MVIKKQPDVESGTISDAANDWFRLFLKHLEMNMSTCGQGLPPDASVFDFSLVAVLAVKMTLNDSGLNDEQIVRLFGHAAFESTSSSKQTEWTAALNQRRFELIDRDIQGSLTEVERLELAGLTQIMREYVDSEHHLPIKGARSLHLYLMRLGSDEAGSGQ